MKREFLKGFAMLMLIVALAFATAVVSANAQTSNKVAANIPFDFVVGDKAMPSGKYTVKAASLQGDGLIIQSADARSSAFRLTNAIAPQRSKTHARLVFHRYGDRYFLAEVWSGYDSPGRQLNKSRQERAIERELASIPSPSKLGRSTYETVEVLAVLR